MAVATRSRTKPCTLALSRLSAPPPPPLDQASKRPSSRRKFEDGGIGEHLSSHNARAGAASLIKSGSVIKRKQNRKELSKIPLGLPPKDRALSKTKPRNQTRSQTQLPQQPRSTNRTGNMASNITDDPTNTATTFPPTPPMSERKQPPSTDAIEENSVSTKLESPDSASKLAPKRVKKSKKGIVKDETIEAIASEVGDGIPETPEKPKKKKRQAKLPYGLTPGESPFPDHPKPTPEECHEVNRILSLAHGTKAQPKVIPAPSGHITGCGNVPNLLDALLRTLLSANTNGSNSNRSMAGLKSTFGERDGSADWSSVHQASQEEVQKAIQSGGLAERKSGYIKNLLDAVYNHNRACLEKLLKEKNLLAADDYAARKQKDLQIAQLGDDFLSMDYVFKMLTDDAMLELVKLPGIGIKTASCVIMFCMQRPSFAVDTHIWRLCKWLGWVPDEKSTTPDKTYRHCEVRIPDELKYSLHILLIEHGKKCVRCKASTGNGSSAWNMNVCSIENLLTRSGERKSGIPAGKEQNGQKAAGSRKRKHVEVESGDEGDADEDSETDDNEGEGES